MIKPLYPRVASTEPWAAWPWLLTVFDGNLGLFSIIKKGVTWERKRNPQTTYHTILISPGQTCRGRAGETGSDCPLCRVGLFQKEPWRPSGLYKATLKPTPRGDNLLVLKGCLERFPRGQVFQQALRFSEWALVSESWLRAWRPGL